MLTEIPNPKQEPGGGHRRWFEGDGLELIVWYERDRTPCGFQLCYHGDDRREHALTWQPASGFSHARVDDGESRPDKNRTPILVKNGAVAWERVQGEFAQCSGSLEPAVRDYVLSAFNARGR